MSNVSAVYTAAAAYPAGTPVYESSAGVATATDLSYRSKQLGVLRSSVASGGVCDIVREGTVEVICHEAAAIGEFAFADTAQVIGLVESEIMALTAGRCHTALGQFLTVGSGVGAIATIAVNLTPVPIVEVA